MKKNNLKIVKIDKNKSLFNYEKKVLIKDLVLNLKLGYYDFEKIRNSNSASSRPNFTNLGRALNKFFSYIQPCLSLWGPYNCKEGGNGP